jgi:hypothetical protein
MDIKAVILTAVALIVGLCLATIAIVPYFKIFPRLGYGNALHC